MHLCILRLSSVARQAQRLQAKECSFFTYIPGINDWPFKIASEKYVKHFITAWMVLGSSAQ